MIFDTGTFVRKATYQTEDTGYDIYLLIGQSNAAGRGYLLDEDKTRNLQGVMQWDPFNETMEAAMLFSRLTAFRLSERM